MGYRNLRVLDEGIPGWVQQGYPTQGWESHGPLAPHGDDTYRAVGVAPPARVN